MNQDQELRYTKLQLRAAQQENARLRKKLQETCRHGRRVEQAYQDALLLAEWRMSHIIPSRDYAKFKGKMSQRRWQNAIGLLRLARVINGPRQWTITDLTIIDERLQVAKQRALESPEAYKMRLNKHANHL